MARKLEHSRECPTDYRHFWQSNKMKRLNVKQKGVLLECGKAYAQIPYRVSAFTLIKTIRTCHSQACFKCS